MQKSSMNSKKTSRNGNDTIWMGFFLIIIMYLMVSKVSSIYNSMTFIFNDGINVYIFLFLTILFYLKFFQVILSGKKIPLCIIVAITFGCFSLISTLVNGNKTFIQSVISTFIWVEVFVLSYIFSISCYKVKAAMKIVLAAFIIITLQYLMYNINPIYVNAESVNSIYYIVLFLPFILYIKKQNIKALAIFIILSLSMISMKRTAIIALIIGLTIDFLMSYNAETKSRDRKMNLFFLVFIFLAVVLFYNYFSSTLNFDIISRFENLTSDGGSNRDIIYELVWDAQLNSDLNEWIIGRGHEGVFLSSNVGTSAHNDLLEILYDYGIIGVLSYIAFIYFLVKKAILAQKKRLQIAGPFAASVLIFITISMFSNLIVIPSYFLLLCVFWGMMLGEIERILKDENIMVV